MLLSIIIINYNTFRLTCECIRSIKETASVEHEIILIDNNSKECAAEEFLTVFPDIKLIALSENVGFARANNLGVGAANGKYVLLLNSDTVVHQRTIDETVGYMEAHPNADVLGCRVLLADNTTPQTTVVKYEGESNFFRAVTYLCKRNTFFVETRIFLSNIRQRRKNGKRVASAASEKSKSSCGAAVIPNYHNGKRIGALVGVFLLLKRSVYQESKGFDPDFFMYFEELEWFAKRLKKYNIVYYPHVSILHYHGSSDVYKSMSTQFFVSQYLFWYKMGYAQYFFFFVYMLLEIPSRLLVRYMYMRPRPSKDIPQMIKSLPYFFKVLGYSNRYGGRPAMLKLNSLQKKNL